MKEIIVIYHANCDDGFSGAWAAWKKLGNRAEYIARKHSDEPRVFKNKTIYCIDIVYPYEAMQQLVKNNTVIVIDHHKTAEPQAKLAHTAIFDLSHSGATLTWRYFFPNTPTPRLLRHVEDSDLGKWKLPHTREITVGISRSEQDFKQWSALVRKIENSVSRKKHIEKGKIIINFTNDEIQTLIKNNADTATFEGHTCLVINFPGILALHSPLGNALVKALPPISIVWSERRGTKVFSLRSNGTVDVSAIAKKYGGGGHPQAAGFALPATHPLPWKYITT